MLFKKLKAAMPARASAHGDFESSTEFPLETEEKLNNLHARAPVERHLQILFQDARVGGESFDGLYRRCLQATGTAVTPFNVFRRFESRLNLVRYLAATLPVAGARAECGVFRGASALLLCHAARAHDAAYAGQDLFLIDSYQGASESGEQDLIPVRAGDGSARMEPFFPHRPGAGWADAVQATFREFPAARIVQGWVPQVLSQLPDRRWSFVHLEVDLYEPTLGALEYFYPRVNAGGVIITDDYGPIFTPGGRKAWQDFCTCRAIPYAVLSSGQAVIMKSGGINA